MRYFGENFTVEGMPDDQIHIGDVFRIGGALVEVTQPRLPCFKLEMKVDLPAFAHPYDPA
jgi:MOSC domain-containing protein YiiM